MSTLESHFDAHWWVIQLGDLSKYVYIVRSDLDEPKIVWVDRLSMARAFRTRFLARQFIKAWGRCFEMEKQRPKILKLLAGLVE